MPYQVYEEEGQFCVHKKNADGGKGALVPGGCHGDKSKANAHLRALYAAENKENREKSMDEVEVQIAETKEYYDYYVPWGVTTFSELDQWREAKKISHKIMADTEAFNSMIQNIMGDSELDMSSKSSAIRSLSDEFASRIDSDVSGGEMKEVVENELNDRPATLSEKAIEFFEGLIGKFIKEQPDDMVYKSGVNIFKAADGSYRWLGRYSNNIRDDDRPREIISSESHRRFVDRVDKGLAPLPELWIWHGEPMKIGMSDFVAYDDYGFAVAGGKFDKRLSEEAIKEIGDLPEMAMSHGMPKHSIKRDKNDPTVIIEHESKEISLLPRWAAANKRTDWVILEDKEDKMFSNEDKEKLIQWGISPDSVAAIERLNQADAEKAADEGVESKETNEAEGAAEEGNAEQETQDSTDVEKPAETESVPETSETEDAPETSETESDDKEASVDIAAVIRDELKPLVERVDLIETVVKALAESQEKTNKALEDTPPAALGSILSNIRSAIGSDDTRVDGRTTLAKSKPKEAENPAADGRTLVPFVNKFLAGE